MDKKDWDFIIGNLGDPLADIKDCMLPPYSKQDIKRIKIMRKKIKSIVKLLNKENKK